MPKEQRDLKAREIVFRMLKLRLYSEQEIRTRLTKKQIEPKFIEDTIQYFKELEFIDDRKFTRQWIASRLAKSFGATRIRFELRHKGIGDDLLNEELKVIAQDYDEERIVEKLAHKRAQVYHGIPKDKLKQRVYGYLARRGFSSYAIGKAMREI